MILILKQNKVIIKSPAIFDIKSMLFVPSFKALSLRSSNLEEVKIISFKFSYVFQKHFRERGVFCQKKFL